MADWLRDNDIAAIIDATHPFATQISANAVAAARATDTSITRIHRPPWTPETGETWIEVPDIDAAAKALPSGARAFLATGRGSQDAFIARRDVWCALRLIDPPRSIFPGNGEYVVSRVLGARGVAFHRWYRVAFEGYGPEDIMWLHHSNVLRSSCLRARAALMTCCQS